MVTGCRRKNLLYFIDPKDTMRKKNVKNDQSMEIKMKLSSIAK